MRRSVQTLGMLLAAFFLVLMPPARVVRAQETAVAPPPVSQPLVTEGVFAVDLAVALGVSTTSDPVTAETELGKVQIAPQNGWVNDYPMTPDVVAEIRQSVIEAAVGGDISLSEADALARFDATSTTSGLAVQPFTGTALQPDQQAVQPASCANYPNPASIASAHTSEGPPVVTYYCPPPDYYYQYDWVPYPFWWTDFWFPGYFILRDFHRHVHYRNHFVLVSNHFRDSRRHRMYRIDPVDRFHGRSFGGIGVRSHRGVISTGRPGSGRAIFNAPRESFTPSRSGGMRGGGAGGAVGGAGFRSSGGGVHSSGAGAGVRSSGGGSRSFGGGSHGSGGRSFGGGGGGGSHSFGGGGGGMRGGGGGGMRR